MNIYSIKNEKLGYFNRPIYCESEAEALSYIQNVLLSDADRALSNLKGDLSLYIIGEIDFTSGIIEPYVFLVCSLEEIFNTIPEERLKPKLTEADMKRAYEKIGSLEKTVEELNEKISSHRHHRKEILK